MQHRLSLQFKAKLSCLQERLQALLKKNPSQAQPLPFIVKTSSFTKNRLRYSLKLKADSVTESATGTVVATLRKGLKLY